MRGLADVAREFGDGDIRLTVWQNLLISGVADAKRRGGAGRDRGARALDQRKLDPRRPRRLHRQCRLQASPPPTPSATPRTSRAGARRASRSTAPVNIHLTGCHHSCAQHYIGDIGLVGARLQVSDEGDTVEGYHILVGGGFGPDAAIGRELYRDVKAEDAPRLVERMLQAYLAHRAVADESFLAFARRHEIDALKSHV